MNDCCSYGGFETVIEDTSRVKGDMEDFKTGFVVSLPFIMSRETVSNAYNFMKVRQRSHRTCEFVQHSCISFFKVKGHFGYPDNYVCVCLKLHSFLYLFKVKEVLEILLCAGLHNEQTQVASLLRFGFISTKARLALLCFLILVTHLLCTRTTAAAVFL